MKNNTKHILEINLAMLLISTSGVLGRYIDLPPAVTIGIRAFGAALLLAVFIKWKKLSFSLSRKDAPIILLSGVLMGSHWITYFYSLQLSNVAIGMLSLFTYPVMTSLLEPIFFKTRFSKMHMLLGLLVLIGIYFLAPELTLENDNFLAILIGLLSALFFAVRNLLVKKKIKTYNGSVIMWYQVLTIAIMLIPAYFIFETENIVSQLPYIGILALVTTALGHTLFLFSLKHFSVTTASLMSSMQPIYGIILGIIFLSEVPGWRTVVGGALILVSVAVESIRAGKSTH
ncbi:DMT family transporter [Dokdonia sp. Hel_I_53]|uniref:DMT family transporter n=1 Tax=Dokdonia sp. Hel_I_53 TaxID=1566287 RepID=UPI00119B6CCC|nr:DMT family transporter [Dokdonia sp. Hel_I_53]TVZ51850.1 threonine/homoserine efflux transporter RhtA [Dokdonia sp. Hel_I_53]